MTVEPIKSCFGCKFSDFPHDNEGKILLTTGVKICRHDPPVLMMTMTNKGMQQQWAWPLVGKTDFCHQFGPRSNGAEEETRPVAEIEEGQKAS